MGRVLGAGFLHLHGAWYPQLPDVRERLSADGQAERGAGGPVLPRYGADGGVQRTGGQFACIYSIPYLILRPLRVVQRTIFEKKMFRICSYIPQNPKCTAAVFPLEFLITAAFQ